MSGLGDLVGNVRGSIEGAAVALLVGLDGMVVAGSGRAALPSSWDILAAHYVEILRRAREASQEARIEPPAEVMVCSPSGTMLLRSLDEDYALLVVLRSGAMVGKARYDLRRAADRVLPGIV